ncbi:MAG: trigger factor [Lachnospiraceae bacterium]|nr:trigger factor [Lachnospiraceae bacterium]
MKTKLLTLTAVLACIMLTACSSKDAISGYSSGDVKLGQYKEVTYVPEEVTVTDDEVREEVITRLIDTHKQNVDVEGKTVVENGDIIICDYTGYIDGEQFQGGSTTDAEIEVGNASYIPGFQEGFIGAEIGVEKEFDVTFPDPYELNPDIAGKPATFKVLVHRIVTKETPEYTDEFVAENTEFKTVEEYDNSIRAELTENKQEHADTKKKYDVFLKIIRSSEFDEQAMAPFIISERQRLILQSDSQYQKFLGIDSFTYYNQYLGMTVDEVNEYYDALAKMQAEYLFVLSAVADEENITLTDAEIDEFAEKMRENNGYETIDEMYSDLSTNYGQPAKEVVTSQAKNSKALELITSTALPIQ